MLFVKYSKVINMKTSYWMLLIYFLFILLPFSWVNGQQDTVNYGNIPDELVAYDKYQKAYKYHFLEPTLFYGAGREKIPPTDLKEVRIGFLGPLEGSFLYLWGNKCCRVYAGY